MADLIDRLSRESEHLVPPRPSIPVHGFCAMLRLYSNGTLTRQEVLAEYDLQGDEITQAVLLAKSR